VFPGTVAFPDAIVVGGVGDMPEGERVMRMSVEQPLWRALTGYRILTMIYAIAVRVSTTRRHVARDLASRVILAVAITPANRPEAEATDKRVCDMARQQQRSRSCRSTAATSRHLPW